MEFSSTLISSLPLNEYYTDSLGTWRIFLPSVISPARCQEKRVLKPTGRSHVEVRTGPICMTLCYITNTAFCDVVTCRLKDIYLRLEEMPRMKATGR